MTRRQWAKRIITIWITLLAASLYVGQYAEVWFGWSANIVVGTGFGLLMWLAWAELLDRYHNTQRGERIDGNNN